MYTIGKYPIKFDTSVSQMWNDGANASAEMPEGSEVLSVGQDRNELTIWAKVQANKPMSHHRLVVIGTGWEAGFRPSWGSCYGRIDLLTTRGPQIFHVFPLKEGNGA